MVNIDIENDVPIFAKPYLYKADRSGNNNGKIDTDDEVGSATKYLCANLPSKCQDFLIFMEKAGYQRHKLDKIMTSSLVENISIPKFITKSHHKKLTQITPPLSLNENKSALFLIDFLRREFTDPNLLPPGFTNLPKVIEQALVNGKIRAAIWAQTSPRLFGEYNAIGDELTILVDSKTLPSTPFAKLVWKRVIMHELFHAFQDKTKMGVSGTTEIEGQAYLFDTRYLLTKLGFTKPSPRAIAALKRFGLETLKTHRIYLWYVGLSDAQLANLTKYALSKDAKEWREGALVTGRYYRTILALNEFRSALAPVFHKIKADDVKLSASTFPYRFKAFVLGKEVRVQIPLNVAYNLYKLSKEMRCSLSPEQRIDALSALVQYWFIFAFKYFGDLLKETDKTYQKPNG
jgi:hypothetical protein